MRRMMAGFSFCIQFCTCLHFWDVVFSVTSAWIGQFGCCLPCFDFAGVSLTKWEPVEDVDFLSAVVEPQRFGGFLLCDIRTSLSWVGRYKSATSSRVCILTKTIRRMIGPMSVTSTCTYCTSHKRINTYTPSRGTMCYLHYFTENGSHYSSLSGCSLHGIMGTYHCLKADSLFRYQI